MPRYRTNLPQLSGDFFITDGGIETTLVFHEGLTLPYFAAFDLLKTPSGCDVVRRCYAAYAALAKQYHVGCILESNTWRASADWGDKLGYSTAALAESNRKAVAILEGIRREFETDRTRVVISGCVGPRGDGYDPAFLMDEQEAQRYHSAQVATLRDTEADMIGALTMNYAAEAIGIARASQAAGMPVAISFTVETDGRLPTGQSLQAAIEQVDAATDSAPAYYMINCAHPTHFAETISTDEPWVQRIRGLRANASSKSHAELNESTTLDDGDPLEFGLQNRDLKRRQPHINILGGCCGTDPRHVEQICKSCLPLLQ